VITAHNPGGVDADPAANDAAHRALVAELNRRGLTWWPAAGADPTWTHVEESVAIPGLSQQEALRLGADFGQEAVFMLSPAGLKVIDCATGRMSMTGWHIEPDSGTGDHATGDDHDAGDDHHADDHHAGDDHQPRDHDAGDDHGIEVTVHARPQPEDGLPGLVLAESRWAGARGGEYLLRTQDGYAIYQTNGDETEIDDLDADGDPAAIAAFREFLGVPV
jgi:hypothetical protein